MVIRASARPMIAAAAVAVIWAAAVIAGRAAATHPAVSIAATIDLGVTAAVALYWIAARGGHLPRWTVGATATIGLVIARVALGRGSSAGAVVMTTAGAVELGTVALALVGSRRAVRGWRASAGAPLVARFEAALVAIRLPPRLAAIVATELAVGVSGVIGWRAPAPSATRFTVHRETGWAAYAGVLVFLIAVETVVAHVAIAGFASVTAAWVATALSAYSVVWLVGDVHALRHGGVELERDALVLAIGVRWRGRIPWSAIAEITRGSAPGGSIDASILGANVVLRLATPCTVQGMFGIRREATTLALSIDAPEVFIASVQAHHRALC